MGQIIVRNLDDTLVERLKQKAKREKTSLEQTVRKILAEAARPSRPEIIEEARRIRALVPPSALDSAQLIREDRDNDDACR